MSHSNNNLANSLTPERERYYVLEDLRSILANEKLGPIYQKMSERLKVFLAGKEKNLKAFFSWFREEMDLQYDWSDDDIKEVIRQSIPKSFDHAPVVSKKNHLEEVSDSTRSSIVKLFEYTTPSVLEDFIQKASSKELILLKEDIETLFDKNGNKDNIKNSILRDNNFDDNYLLEVFDKLSSIIEEVAIKEKNKESIQKDLELASRKLQEITERVRIPNISVSPENLGEIRLSDEESTGILSEANDDIKKSNSKFVDQKLAIAHDAMDELLDKDYRIIFTIPREYLDTVIKTAGLKVRPTKYIKSVSILAGTIGRPFLNPLNEDPRYVCVLKPNRHQKYNLTPRFTGEDSFYGVVYTTKDIALDDFDIYDSKTGELITPKKL